MSDDRGDDLNFNELVGSLLSSHNADENDTALGDPKDNGVSEEEEGNAHGDGDVELPDFGVGEEDDALAAVVANAIQNMDDEEPGEVEEANISRNDSFEAEHENEQQEDQHWAQILQQGILQGADAGRHDGSQNEEDLDPDDENLRRAILESLGELNVADREAPEKYDEAEAKSRSKKSSKKKKKKDKDLNKEKGASSKKKKSHKKDKTRKEDLLDFEDVIKGFMRQGSEVPETQESEEVGDEETQALVKATLKAFERELLSSQAAPSAAKSRASSKKKSAAAKPVSTTKKDDGTKGRKPITTAVAEESSNITPEVTKKKKKKKKKQSKAAESHSDVYEGDEFSRALADMVNEVVKTSANDTSNETAEATKEPIPEVIATTPPTEHKQLTEGDQSTQGEETFDLNQIMQKAMSMAFQEQTNESLDNSAMEEFNQGLRDLNVSDILSTGKQKKKSSAKASRKKSTSDTTKAAGLVKSLDGSFKRKTTPKPTISVEETLRKKYSQAASAAAAMARKRISANNKATRLLLKTERKKAREDRRLQKDRQKEQLELERKELEVIVAKGPPYPADLRLTKSGKPKKPYRRWTPEEMESRASMPPEKLQSVSKVRKPSKRKLKKLKKMPLSTLKKLPIFNFVRGNMAADTKSKLNGINDTLRQIPIQQYHLDINELAPPDNVSPEQWEREKKLKEDESIIRNPSGSKQFAFDAARKTVVRREKIPLHPPWIVPSRVPLALPVARRKRKEKPKELRHEHRSSRQRRSSRDGRSSLTPSSRARIIPAVLFPIIKTLKAAARAKSASGASSEEASRHLVAIIRHTKRSIAQTLSLARRQSARNYPAIKSDNDLNKKSSAIDGRNAARIPIFSLARIKQIDTSEDIAAKSQQVHTVKQAPTIVKLEEEPSIGSVVNEVNEKSKGQPESQKIDLNKSAGGLQNREQVKYPDDSMIDESLREDSLGAGNLSSPDKGSTVEQKRTSKDSPDKEIEDNAEKAQTNEAQDKSQNTASSEKAFSEESANSTISRKAIDVKEGIPASNAVENDLVNHGNYEVEQPVAEKSTDLSGKRERLTSLKSEVSDGSDFDRSSMNFLRETINHSDMKGEQKVLDLLDSLVESHLAPSEGNPVSLPADVRNEISSTIEELIPVMNEHETRDVLQPQHKRYRKGPPPVLNLDGLVPPISLNVVPKVEETARQSIPSRSSPKARKPRRKAEQPVLLYEFNVPDFKNMQGRRTMLLKRAKNYLTNDEMNTLKKEINKERKRKWREANVEKNWENDLRARVKKRANAKFGENESIEKSKWYQDEVNRSLNERGIKHEETDRANDDGIDKKTIVATNLSDNEVLNMVASTLNKLDLARLLERELNEDAANFPENKANKKKLDTSKGPTNAVKPTAPAEDPAVMSPTYDEQESFHGQELGRPAADEVDESGNAKRPYPDDIPVSVPLTKRQKAIGVQEDT